MLRLSLSSLVLAAALAAPARAEAPPPAAQAPGPSAQRARYLMGTVCEGIAYGEQAATALDAAFDEIARLESILSDYRPDSELSRLNREAAAAPFACSADLFDFLVMASELSRASGGAFDVTVAPLIAAWDLRGSGRVPAPFELAQARRRVGWSLLSLDPAQSRAWFAVDGMAIDPGALGKGYALDAAARVLRARGVSSALIDFGGQVLALGAPPGAAVWEVDLAHPLHRGRPALTIALRDASASTSGNAERHVQVGRRRLGHIVDPRTGRPTENSGSVTVTAASAAAADAWSTALLVLGPVEGTSRLETMPDLSAIWLEPDADGRLQVIRRGHGSGNNPARAVRAGLDKDGGVR